MKLGIWQLRGRSNALLEVDAKIEYDRGARVTLPAVFISLYDKFKRDKEHSITIAGDLYLLNRFCASLAFMLTATDEERTQIAGGGSETLHKRIIFAKKNGIYYINITEGDKRLSCAFGSRETEGMLRTLENASAAIEHSVMALNAKINEGEISARKK